VNKAILKFFHRFYWDPRVKVGCA